MIPSDRFGIKGKMSVLILGLSLAAPPKELLKELTEEMDERSDERTDRPNDQQRERSKLVHECVIG